MVESVAEAKKHSLAGAKTIRPTPDKPYGPVIKHHGLGTRNVSFQFRLLASFASRQTRETRINRPDFLDSKVRPLDPMKTNIGAGSMLKVAFEVHRFYVALLGAGVSLRLRAVQVLNLVEPTSSDAEAYGFVEEEGYEATPRHPVLDGSRWTHG
jgi:hypothetical protein